MGKTKEWIKSLCTVFLAWMMVWQLMCAGLAFGQAALLDVSFRLMLTFAYAVTVLALWEDGQ